MYESLTRFLPDADNLNAYEFFNVVHDFVDANPVLELRNYKAILKENNIHSFDDIDVSAFDGKIVAAIVVGIVRQDRFCEGLLDDCIKDGTVAKCLSRLKEIDEDAP